MDETTALSDEGIGPRSSAGTLPISTRAGGRAKGMQLGAARLQIRTVTKRMACATVQEPRAASGLESRRIVAGGPCRGFTVCATSRTPTGM